MLSSKQCFLQIVHKFLICLGLLLFAGCDETRRALDVDDTVGLLNSLKFGRGHDHCDTFLFGVCKQIVDGNVDLGLTLEVQVSDVVVNQDEFGVGDDGASNGKAVLLTERQLDAAIFITNQSVELVLELEHELSIGQFDSFYVLRAL